jgi:hypothetical protein
MRNKFNTYTRYGSLLPQFKDIVSLGSSTVLQEKDIFIFLSVKGTNRLENMRWFIAQISNLTNWKEKYYEIDLIERVMSLICHVFLPIHINHDIWQNSNYDTIGNIQLNHLLPEPVLYFDSHLQTALLFLAVCFKREEILFLLNEANLSEHKFQV